MKKKISSQNKENMSHLMNQMKKKKKKMASSDIHGSLGRLNKK